MKRKTIVLMALMALSFMPVWAQSCMIYNWAPAPDYEGDNDFQEHLSGSHGFAFVGTGSCNYTKGYNGDCTVKSIANASAGMTEAAGSLLRNPFYGHVTSYSQQGGTVINGSGSAIANSVGAGTVKSCLGGFCSASVSISGSAGAGFSVSFPPDQLWGDQRSFSMGCEAETSDLLPPTPIVIDAYGEGFHLTSADNGVTFDILADGKPIQISWTDPAYHNGWLVLDRNGNGTIDSGAELFGNVTPQPDNKRPPNGYLALAVFDTPAAGGNGDGVIDEKDAVFSNLRIWIDSNHDGKSQPEELHTLPSLGITSLSLKYHPNDFVDDNGNHFRLQSRVNPGDPIGLIDRKDYDVFLVKK
jgi:hypothetical protein